MKMLIPVVTKFVSSSSTVVARPFRSPLAQCQWMAVSRTLHSDRLVMLNNSLRTRKHAASIIRAAGSMIAVGLLYRWYSWKSASAQSHAGSRKSFTGSPILRQVYAEEAVQPMPLVPRSRSLNFVADLVDTITPAVVSVLVQCSHHMHPGMLYLSQGSGFVVRENGLILTNAHVVANQVRVEVKFSDGRRLPGRVLYADGVSDLAAIKVEATNLPCLRLGSVTKPRVGEWVVAVGSPHSLANTVTTGVVSAFRVGAELGMQGQVEKSINYIQTDAAITVGNSGGPLLNLDGDVIGINARKVKSLGIAFAIPSDQAKSFLDKIDSLEQSNLQAKLPSPSDPVGPQSKVIGVTLLTMEPTLSPDVVMAMVQRSGGSLEAPNGVVIVYQIMPESPAAKAGLRQGDQIISVNGKSVGSAKEVFDMVDQEAVLVIEINRNGLRTLARLEPELVQLAADTSAPPLKEIPVEIQ
ncbi:serine protease HTRA2, mitochondrial-like [Paramacrobiotus metropolitanus]|uniref:serine protease HTRA2, mitochondrial-like n=1 Tax=Paramacrobiotus metropolitanus TaxID=2943436 RepID=UPI002445E620|nr:serine protease HTRA2, mitochondrial-like [Paramacrobiotus metropolitanus]